MKYPFIRRAEALALALILTLTLAISMTAPAWAEDAPVLSIKIQEDKEGSLVVGDEVTLVPVLSGVEDPYRADYSWDCSDRTVLSANDWTGDSITVKAAKSGDAAITLTASDRDTGEVIATAGLELKVTALEITLNGAAAGASAQLVNGQTARLAAVWSNGTPAGIAAEDIDYEWTRGNDSGAVSWPEDGTDKTNSITVTAEEAGKTADVTVTAVWTGGEEDDPQTLTARTLTLEVIEPQLEKIEVAGATDNELAIGETATLTVKWVNGQRPDGVTYSWTSSDEEIVSVDAAGNPVTAKAIAPGPAEITVTATWNDGTKTQTAACTLTVKAVAAEGIKLDQTELTLAVGKKAATLTAAVSPSNATNQEITWTSSDAAVVTVTPSADGKTCTVTAVGAGAATVTAAVGEGITAVCEVTVLQPGITIVNNSPIWTNSTPDNNKSLSVLLTGLDDKNPTVTWSAAADPAPGVVEPTFSAVDASATVVMVNEQTAGVFAITASCTDSDGVTYSAVTQLTISGIVLSGTEDLDARNKTLKMVVGGSRTLTTTAFGEAVDTSSNPVEVEWYSSDPNVVYVLPSGGSLTAYGIGTAVITASKGEGSGRYTAECTVTVEEDKSAIADSDLSGRAFTASISEPLVLDAVFPRLMRICTDKLQDMFGITDSLSYITNLKVSPDQGTLYYNYSTESDTGTGVGYNDRFAAKASGTTLGADKLYFVPKQGFIGTAEITFSAVSTGSRNFTGAIRIEVEAGPDSVDGTYQIGYGVRAGEAVWFSASDFINYCQSVNGRSYNYVVFNLPKASEGVLYYNYVAGSGNPVTTSIQFTRSGRYTIDDVCFVANAALEGNSKVIIGFRAVDTSGAVVDGTVTINVTAASTSADPSSVTVSGERGRPVTLQSELFNAACKDTINDTLSFVTFKLPDQAEGTLYYNYRSNGTYDSRVTAATRCYYSGVPGLGSVTFVPASSAAGRIAISYTGYGAGGASYSGTLYISLEEVDRSVIHYSVAKGGTVTFNTADFNNAGLYRAGTSVTYVVFTHVTGTGQMYYNAETKVNPSSTRYYISPTGTYRGLGQVYFAAGDTVGTVTVTYDAYNSSGARLFTGTVVIQVGSSTPKDIELSCKTGGQASLSASTLNSVCGAVMSSLSYIEITGVPDAKEGHLYFNYSGFGTGTAVEQGDRFYRVGSPGISQLTFVPFARFAGEAEITYIAYSSDGQEQVSGRITVDVTKSAASLYFDDMGSYAWAADSVDYLRRNGTVIGVGDNSYNPSGSITRGDFVLMLVRAYGFTAAGNASFSDVPDDSYYADAIRIAHQLGIVNGYEGKFRPDDALTRQDAMLIILNAMRAGGKTVTNGLATVLNAYYDGEQVDAYAREAMGSLVQMGIIEGDGNGYLRPHSQLNRAEAAVLLHTIMTL